MSQLLNWLADNESRAWTHDQPLHASDVVRVTLTDSDGRTYAGLGWDLAQATERALQSWRLRPESHTGQPGR